MISTESIQSGIKRLAQAMTEKEFLEMPLNK
jgi:hypothetical protein